MRIPSSNKTCLESRATLYIVALSILCQSLVVLSQTDGNQSNNKGGIVGAVTSALTGGNSNQNQPPESGSNAPGASASMGASLNTGNGGGASIQASGSIGAGSAAQGTPKPEGILGKIKGALKDVKDTVTNTDSNNKADDKGVAAKGSISLGPIQASASLNAGTSETTAQPSSWLFGGPSKSDSSWDNNNNNMGANMDASISTSKPFLEKIGDMARRGKDAIVGKDSNAESNVGGNQKDGVFDKVQKVVAKGTDAVRDTAMRIGDKANEMGEKLTNTFDENVKKPMSNVSGSGQYNSEGRMTSSASYTSQLRGSDREKYLVEQKQRQDENLGARQNNIKDIVNDARSKGVIPRYEDRSVLRGNQDDDKSVALAVFDKAHEMSKLPVETMMKPIDRMLGYEKDPLLKMYDSSHEVLRKPLGMITKPVDSLITGAFKTTDESREETKRLLATSSEQERRENKMREDRARERSIAGNIADKTINLATKPIEIVLRPMDHMFGLDKKGKKNPLLSLIDEIYALSKKPVDQVARPFEKMLRKMGEGEQPMYQISLRYSDNDPKLVTRLADGALNIAGRAFSKPMEIFMRPLNHALGYDDPGKKNPLLDAMNQFKNATKGGVELFTKPIDRIIKEIAEIGDIKDENEREMMWQRKREEAGRIVKALDKLHEVLQIPLEIVLKPVDSIFGLNAPGQKDPMLRAWDVVHQVMRTPLQVVTRPIEDAILGENHRQRQAAINARNNANKRERQSPMSPGESRSGIAIPLKSEMKKNVFVSGIRKVEKIAIKPIEVVSSPIRRLILGEDDSKAATNIDKFNREAVQGKPDNRATNRMHEDRILHTLDSINNVALMPLEIMTQPLSDMITGEKKLKFGKKHSNQYSQNSKKGIEVKGQVKAGTGQHEASAQAQMKVKT